MGMTIEQARAALGKERKYALHENKQAFDIAIEIMRKYQSIEQIVDRPTGDNAEEKAYNYMMIVKDIKEVVEDGKID